MLRITGIQSDRKALDAGFCFFSILVLSLIIRLFKTSLQNSIKFANIAYA